MRGTRARRLRRPETDPQRQGIRNRSMRLEVSDKVIAGSPRLPTISISVRNLGGSLTVNMVHDSASVQNWGKLNP